MSECPTILPGAAAPCISSFGTLADISKILPKLEVTVFSDIEITANEITDVAVINRIGAALMKNDQILHSMVLNVYQSFTALNKTDGSTSNGVVALLNESGGFTLGVDMDYIHRHFCPADTAAQELFKLRQLCDVELNPEEALTDGAVLTYNKTLNKWVDKVDITGASDSRLIFKRVAGYDITGEAPNPDNDIRALLIGTIRQPSQVATERIFNFAIDRLMFADSSRLSKNQFTYSRIAGFYIYCRSFGRIDVQNTVAASRWGIDVNIAEYSRPYEWMEINSHYSVNEDDDGCNGGIRFVPYTCSQGNIISIRMSLANNLHPAMLEDGSLGSVDMFETLPLNMFKIIGIAYSEPTSINPAVSNAFLRVKLSKLAVGELPSSSLLGSYINKDKNNIIYQTVNETKTCTGLTDTQKENFLSTIFPIVPPDNCQKTEIEISGSNSRGFDPGTDSGGIPVTGRIMIDWSLNKVYGNITRAYTGGLDLVYFDGSTGMPLEAIQEGSLDADQMYAATVKASIDTLTGNRSINALPLLVSSTGKRIADVYTYNIKHYTISSVIGTPCP